MDVRRAGKDNGKHFGHNQRYFEVEVADTDICSRRNTY